MTGAYLLRGMLCGLIAGLCGFLFAHQFGEPEVARAIAFETQRQIASHEAPEPELFSRTVQSGIGLFTAVVVVGTALGGLFSIACAFAYGRMGRLSARASSGLIALAAFVVIDLVPGMKYPANPPSVGVPATIGMRTELFFSMIGVSIALAVLAVVLGLASVRRFGAWNATIVAVATYAITVGLVATLLPSVNEVPTTFSATLLWNFRIASIGTFVIIWSVLGLLFGALTERSEQRGRGGAMNVRVSSP